MLVSISGLQAHELGDPNEVLRAHDGERTICLGVEHRGVETELCYEHD